MIFLNKNAFAAMLIGSLLMVTGCSTQSKYGPQITKVDRYPDCYQPIAELRKSEGAVGRSAAGGAVLGGLLGAAAGYLVTGNTSGALIGAAGGAVIGGTAGYYTAKGDQEKEDTARLAEYADALDGNISSLNRTTAAARVARQCYERQFEVAVSEFKEKNIAKQEFNNRYTEISNGLSEAATILGQVNTESTQLSAQYRQALDGEADRMGVPKDSLAAPAKTKKPAKRSPDTTKKLQTEEGKKLAKLAEKTETMETAVADVKAEEALLKDRLVQMQRQSADLMS